MARLGTWLRRAGVALAALFVLVLVVLCLAFWAPGVRSLWVARALQSANAQLPFRVQIKTVVRLDPWGATLVGIRLLDTQGVEMLRVQRLALTLEPLALASQRVHVTSLTVQGVHGLIDPEKLTGPSEPEEPPGEPSDLTVVVNGLALDDVDVRMAVAGKAARLGVERLRAAGAWGKVPALALSEGKLWAELDGQRVQLVPGDGRSGE